VSCWSATTPIRITVPITGIYANPYVLAEQFVGENTDDTISFDWRGPWGCLVAFGFVALIIAH
jgi:hypothetical protein